MKFFVGYQLFKDFNFTDCITQRKDHISEVYFSWGDFPNGRNCQIDRCDMTPWDAQQKQIEDLKIISDAGINTNILFNATCYGKDSQSRSFFEKIGDITDYCIKNLALSSVTTTSPLIAKFIKTNFPAIDVRASVNMGIGTVEGMEYVEDYFDSFYVKRELNRDFSKIRELKKWCNSKGKKLYALANSGCLNNCSAHTFHDNLVSHEKEISQMDNGYAFSGICHEFLKKKDNMYKILDNTAFIRPEDIYLYEDLFDSMKLATRVSANPEKILRAYIDNRKHIGSTLDLLEPNHSGTIYPYILENSCIKAEYDENSIRYTNIENCLIDMEEKTCLKVN